MLSAILHGKKTGTGLAGTRLKIGETQGAEDVLTATVFERIAYLPDDIFIQFIELLFEQKEYIGRLVNIKFWDRFEGVEPDVILNGSRNQSIIVEAKRYDNAQQQYAEQLARELFYAEKYGDIFSPILLTVGGLDNYSDKTKERLNNQIQKQLKRLEAEDGYKFSGNYRLYCVSWQELYICLDKSIQEKPSANLMRLLSDIREAYEWHGIRYRPYQWLESIKHYHLTTGKFPTIFVPKKWQFLLPSVKIKHTTFSSFLGA